MALQGTLKDFGIADILQLIGQQQKTGTLHLRSRDQAVHVAFRDGVIVRAESTRRRRRDLIGAMLVRAELITEAQLQDALEVQKRSGQRLGDVLVSLQALGAERFRKMVQLQMTETLYGLFTWKSGTYAFEAGEVETASEDTTPLRAESVLMEGFRRVDEWPLLQRTLPSEALTFVRKRPLPPEGPARSEEDALDAAFGGGGPGEQSGELKSLGPAERAVWAKAEPGRTLRKLVDVCLLGEFDTWKALYNLVSLGYLEPVLPAGRSGVGPGAEALRRRAASLGRWALSVAVLLALAGVAVRVSAVAPALSRARATRFEDAALQRHLSRAQQARIRAALDVYRLEHGEYPPSLGALEEEALLTWADLRFPWAEPYHYRRTSAHAFVLLPPLR